MESPCVALVNLGCSKNLVDGENILGWFASRSFIVVSEPAQAQVVLVNTCTFIQEATQEAIDTILEATRLKTDGNCATLIVSGCFSQRYRKEAATDFPEVDHWISVDNWEEELTSLFPASRTGAAPLQRVICTGTPTQYLKIAEGCSHGCSFCIIPSVRGRYHSRHAEDVVREARWLEEQGARECILVAQDTSRFGREHRDTLTRLVERILRETAIPWIRLMYLHPATINDSLLRLMESEQRLCSYIDVPLQHYADTVLEAMNRRPLSRGIDRVVERIRTLAPSAAIRTTFITGFPAETPAAFRELLSFVERTRFEKLGVFPFSPEAGTPAAQMRPRPRAATAHRRSEILMDLQREISRQIGESRIGTSCTVLLEESVPGSAYHFEGRTQWDAPEVDGKVHLEEGDGTVGCFAAVRIVDADAYDLFARPLQTQ